MTRPGTESTKKCGNCGTVWRDSWLEPDVDRNECPFCYAYFDTQTVKTVRLIKIKKKRMHWKTVSAIKLLCRLGSDIHECDWTIFKKDSYIKLLQRRTDIIKIFNQKLEDLLDRLNLHKK